MDWLQQLAPRAPTPFSRERPAAVHEGLAFDLGLAIVSGRLASGAMLPGEERFSAESGVSRGAYREAIKILGAKGLVQSRHKSGTRVNERHHWNMLDLDVLAWMFQAGPSEEFVRSIFELRAIVEPAAAALCASRRTDAELAQMRASLDRMAQYGLMHPEGRAGDQAFHHAILIATRNEPLISLSSTIASGIEWTTRLARIERGRDRDPMPDHRAVFTAIAARDPGEARRAMADLVAHAGVDSAREE